jgi:hypothetical protein
MPRHGFSRCDGHHKMVDVQKKALLSAEARAVLLAFLGHFCNASKADAISKI